MSSFERVMSAIDSVAELGDDGIVSGSGLSFAVASDVWDSIVDSWKETPRIDRYAEGVRVKMFASGIWRGVHLTVSTAKPYPMEAA